MVKAGELYIGRRRGGVNDGLIKVIAVYEGKAWIHNLNTDSMPIVKIDQYEFKPAGEYIEELQKMVDSNT